MEVAKEELVGDYRKLDVWRVADDVAVRVYTVTGGFPIAERFGLTSQMRRAAVSVPSNIAEGCGRNGRGDLRRFIQVALGSANELDYQLSLSTRLGYVESPVALELHGEITRVRQMLGSMLRGLGRT